MGQVNFLRMLISNLARMTVVFAPLLKIKSEVSFKWEEVHQKAFEKIKEYLTNPPVLMPPKESKSLKLYISAGERFIGSLLAQDNDQAFYYLSRKLNNVECNYSCIEKLCLVLYYSAIKLRHYILQFTVCIITQTDVVKYMLTRPLLIWRIEK